MAEATYYLKAYCDSDVQAEAIAEEVKVLFAELDQVYAEKWNYEKLDLVELAKQFPHSAELLSSMDFNATHRFPDVGFAEGNLDIGGSILYYSATVNHLNDWTPITKFMQTKWGCKVDWISDEYVNPFDLI